ncbi:MAG: ABC transporter substrate-binding protein, partial [Acetobacteraceae bacterium]
MNRRECLGLAVLAVLVLAGPALPASAETIKLGAIVPLTGPGAVVGNQEKRGIEFAIDEANAKGGVHGRQIEVVYEDNQAKP